MSFLRLRTGAKGEHLAEKHLLGKGFRTVDRNLRRRAGEIDLLMMDGEELVIVEVRTVTEAGELSAGDRIPASKRRQLIRITEVLLDELDDPLPPVRFDACLVVLKPRPRVTHIPNAFRADDFDR